ncbi:MAG: peptide deformylase [Gammaproteobacteria bacterium]|nr:peptide deformylase [Gammaproteobacteria bacterium]
MAKLDILIYPDPRLRQVAKPVDHVDDNVQQLVDNMFETMYRAPGIGLAATQVNVHKRIIVIDVSEDKSEPRVFINPEITEAIGEQTMPEGCLSVPSFYEEVVRADAITVNALDQNGEHFTLQAEGLLAVCIQHEIDHLNGKLFTDHLSKLKRNRIKKKLEKQQKANVL